MVYLRHFETKVMQMVDQATQKRLDSAKDSKEILEVLKGQVNWKLRARCLRHPLSHDGCEIPLRADLVPWLTWPLNQMIEFFWRPTVARL